MRMNHPYARTRLALASALLLLTACAELQIGQDSQAPLQPEVASGYSTKADVVAHQFAVATANPLATQAGFDILKAGGSAVDAAIAVQMVLGLVEPQSSGLGGGAFMLHSMPVQDGKPDFVQAYDGRETAPAAADENLFLNPDGKPMAFHAAVVGGRAVGTPGLLRMLGMAHAQHGKLPWPRLFEPAIALAEQGFAISPRLYASLKADAYLRLDPSARAYFYQADGTPHPVGHVLKNPELAEVLRGIARGGVPAFYRGEVAQAVVNKVKQHASNPGRLTMRDMAYYQAKERRPMCFDHTAQARAYRVCGFPPPSSGAIAMGQILGMLQQLPPAVATTAASPWQGQVPDPLWLHTYVEASRLAFADRALYVADPAFVSAPAGDWHSLLDPDYLKQRAALIGPTRMRQVQAGVPARSAQSSYAPMLNQPEYGTSHISIVDAHGHAVAMTSTIEDAFGARQMVKGFLLNNELTDFSFVPRDAQGRVVANRVQPGKRPRSSMSPTLVFDKATGQLVMSMGSPGGSMIIHYATKTMLGVLHWGMRPQQTLDLPNFGSVGGPAVLEQHRFDKATQEALIARGTPVREQTLTSGLQAIVRQTMDGQDVWVGAADGRREGEVKGE